MVAETREALPEPEVYTIDNPPEEVINPLTGLPG